MSTLCITQEKYEFHASFLENAPFRRFRGRKIHPEFGGQFHAAIRVTRNVAIRVSEVHSGNEPLPL